MASKKRGWSKVTRKKAIIKSFKDQWRHYLSVKGDRDLGRRDLLRLSSSLPSSPSSFSFFLSFLFFSRLRLKIKINKTMTSLVLHFRTQVKTVLTTTSACNDHNDKVPFSIFIIQCCLRTTTPRKQPTLFSGHASGRCTQGWLQSNCMLRRFIGKSV